LDFAEPCPFDLVAVSVSPEPWLSPEPWPFDFVVPSVSELTGGVPGFESGPLPVTTSVEPPLETSSFPLGPVETF